MTKRQMGILFIISGVGGALTLIAIDLIGAGRFAGIGPMQRFALLGTGLITFVGISLLPLGDRPA